MKMALKQVLEIVDLLDRAKITGEEVASFFREQGVKKIEIQTVQGEKGKTDFVKFLIPGIKGKEGKGDAPTLGIIGRLGGLGARPTVVGLVSDSDGAVCALSICLKIIDMQNKGDFLSGDVIVSTHICPDAPTQPHEPVPFMGSPVDMATMNRLEVDKRMDAILSFDTTKGNRVINRRGFAISPTVKEGYILRTSEDLLEVMQIVTGKLPAVFPITMQDITPYGNGLFHLNSILQPAIATDAPVVGVAITAEVAVPGCGTGASHEIDIELATRFGVEVAKVFGKGNCRFYDFEEFSRIVALYGSMKHLQSIGAKK
jgi:hypothetical protein